MRMTRTRRCLRARRPAGYQQDACHPYQCARFRGPSASLAHSLSSLPSTNNPRSHRKVMAPATCADVPGPMTQRSTRFKAMARSIGQVWQLS